MSELLEVNHVSYAYHSIDGETETLADISFHIKEGEFAAIVGPSGCGKSTLLSLICGLLKPEKGEILLDGKSIAGEKERIGYMLQKDYLFEWRSIYSNVMLGLEIQKKKSEKYTKRVDQMLKDYGLWDFRDVRPSQLSGGMRQMVSEILEPALVVLNSLPKSALAPLLIVWLGANIKTIILAGMSVAIFGTILNLYTCFSQSSPEKEKLIYTLGGTKKDTLLKVVLPGTVPNILSIMKVNIGLCLVGVVIGEFIGARRGLGYLIIYGSQVFKLDWVLMSIVILCVIAMLLYALLGRLEAACLKRL